MSTSKWKPYPEYKKTGFGWIDSIPNHWNTSRIKHIHRQTINSFIDGDWVESPYIVDNEKIRYITSGNIGEGKFKFQGSGHISEDSFEELNCVEVFPGDLLISRLSLPVGRSCIIPDLEKRIITAVDNVIIRLNSKYNKYFFNYLFNSFESYENTSQLARGTTLQRISRTILGDIETIFPSLEEQQQIVDFLDAQCNSIEPILLTLENELNSLKEKRSALITQAVTKGLNPDVPMKDSGIDWIGEIPKHWKVVKLKYLIQRLESGVSVNASESEAASKEEFGVLKTSSVFNYKFEPNKNKKVFENELERVKCPVKANSIIISRMNTPKLVGASGYVKKNYDNLFLPDRLWQAIFYKNSAESSKFVSNMMISKGFRGIMEKKATGASPSMKNITKEDLLGTNIALPPISEQKNINRNLEEFSSLIDDLSELICNKIEQLEEYRTALISAAVTGKIDVRGLA